MENRLLTGLVADADGNIFELEGYAAVGMAGPARVPLAVANTRPIPHGSELMFLPDRNPILYNLQSGRFEKLLANPYRPGQRIFPVAAFNSPGYLLSYVSAYQEEASADNLPLFAYGAVGWHSDGFRTAVIRVDRERRQDLRFMRAEKVRAGILKMRRKLPNNRLRQHLETCAVTYGCPAGKNFFLGRYEAPLPTARRCNARCLGCLSRQKTAAVPISQERITFTPAPDEIADIAVTHIDRVNRAVVSFGQGCEGDPLTAAHVIEPAIRIIRSRTRRGTINLNTNGSRPEVILALIEAGLDSIRISINSARSPCYSAYFRPVDYVFRDVEESIDLALSRGVFVSINYLNSPGFTDSPEETESLIRFLTAHPIRMIQWRNLNFDPVRYWHAMNRLIPCGKALGMSRLIRKIRSEFPHIIHGYFNPPRERFSKRSSLKTSDSCDDM